MKLQFDLFAPDYKKHSYAFYTELREKAPVYKVKMPNGLDAWLITRYEDALSALKDSRFIKRGRTALGEERFKKLIVLEESEYLMETMLAMDPPDHTRLRSLVSKAFTPKMIQGMHENIQNIADGLLEKMEKGKPIDLMSEFAFPLPIIVISEMLGIPTEDRMKFRDWSNAIIDANNHPDRMRKAGPKIKAFVAYLQELVEKRRQNSTDDLISSLVHAEAEGDKLSEKELYAMIFLLIVAGHETTVNLIGNGVLALLENPDQMALLQQNPELIQTAVEEFLRYYSPVEFTTNRFAIEDVNWHGETIKKGDMVLVALASANRDPEQFVNPDQLDITRKHNPHIGFGYGIHYCLGAPLARLEAQIAISSLLNRFPDIKPGTSLEQLEWRPSFLMRGLKELPVIL
ncbi:MULTISPECIES: cytochrome P450 [Thermoactinomyces]|jgi:cytochrome P450|nr:MULTISPECIES: cytochrome P450 [Thermoactinomyces]